MCSQSLSTPQNSLALGVDEEGIADPALDKGTQAGNALLAEDGLVTRDAFLRTPLLTTPQSKSPQSFPCHRNWSMGR